MESGTQRSIRGIKPRVQWVYIRWDSVLSPRSVKSQFPFWDFLTK